MYSLGIDIGSTTVKVALLDPDKNLVFSDYKRHFANIQETLSSLVSDALQIRRYSITEIYKMLSITIEES